MKTASKMLSLLLAAAMLFCVGCAKNNGQGGSLAQPTPTYRAASTADTQTFTELDRDFFVNYVTSDAVTYHLWLKHPEAFNITEEPEGLGAMTKEANNEWLCECETYLERLKGINRENLSECDKLSYDVIERFIEDQLSERDFYYYYEPFTPYVGTQSNLPLTFAFYELDSLKSVESYFGILRDTVRFFGELEEFERQKSAAGLFMSDIACDNIISDCKTFTESGENCFLITGFRERIDKIDDLSDTKKDELEEQNKDLVLNCVMKAYDGLITCMEELKGTGKNLGGLCEYENGLEYFEHEVRIASCGNLSIEEAKRLLEKEIKNQYFKIYTAIRKDPLIIEKFDEAEFSFGTVEENIEFLKRTISEDYPELPEHEISFFDAPKELEDQISPASYLIPPIDDAYNNLIMLNQKSVEEGGDLLMKLAHEGYPGHMYQYVYQRSMAQLGLFRRIMSLTAYYEGWSQYSEDYIYEHLESGGDVGMIASANTILSGVLLPAMISIGVNAEGWSKADIMNYLKDYGLDYDDYAEYYYNISVAIPTYTLDYALGYAGFYDIYNAYREKMGKKFSLREFHEKYLNIGPAYFDMIKERLIGE